MPKSFQDQELVLLTLFKGMQVLAYLWLSDKDSVCQGRRCGFNPWVGEIPLGKEMATHSSILAWEIPWTEEPGGL